MESMKYSDTAFPVSLDPAQVVAEVHANTVNLPKRTVREHIEYALDHPIGAGPLSEAVHPGDKVCIVISDTTRRWQQPSTYLPILVERLNQAGIPDKDILILCATGTHRQQTEKEHISLVGEDLYRRIQFRDHNCDDKEHLTYMGTTSRGTPVWLNSYAMACDKIILTGGVVYHFLAGFGGGRKSIVPGIAGRETINTNHNNALNKGLGSGSNPKACNGNMTDSNPFHSDLMECAAFAKPAYLLNVIVDDNYQIVGAFAGDWREAHAAAAKVVEQLDGVPIPRRTPLVIASAGGYPKDINLYQTSKTLSNALAAVAPGGTMILLSQCREGFGDPDCEAQICDFDTMEDREKIPARPLLHRRLRGIPLCRELRDLPPDRGHRPAQGAVRPHQSPGGQDAGRSPGPGGGLQRRQPEGRGDHPHAPRRQHLSPAPGVILSLYRI